MFLFGSGSRRPVRRGLRSGCRVPLLLASRRGIIRQRYQHGDDVGKCTGARGFGFHPPRGRQGALDVPGLGRGAASPPPRPDREVRGTGPGVGVGVEVLEYNRQAYALAERHAADTASVKRGGKPPSLGVSWLFAGGPDTDDVHHDESTIPADAPATLKEASSEGLYPRLR